MPPNELLARAWLGIASVVIVLAIARIVFQRSRRRASTIVNVRFWGCR